MGLLGVRIHMEPGREVDELRKACVNQLRDFSQMEVELKKLVLKKHYCLLDEDLLEHHVVAYLGSLNTIKIKII
jgi:hypothetical protein